MLNSERLATSWRGKQCWGLLLHLPHCPTWKIIRDTIFLQSQLAKSLYLRSMNCESRDFLFSFHIAPVSCLQVSLLLSDDQCPAAGCDKVQLFRYLLTGIHPGEETYSLCFTSGRCALMGHHLSHIMLVKKEENKSPRWMKYDPKRVIKKLLSTLFQSLYGGLNQSPFQR